MKNRFDYENICVPNSYPSGHDLCRFIREFTPSFIPTLEDLAIDTIDNGLGMGNDSALQTMASRKVKTNNTVVITYIFNYVYNNKLCLFITYFV